MVPSCEACGRVFEFCGVYWELVPACDCNTCPRCDKRFRHDDWEHGVTMASSDEDADLYGEPYCQTCWEAVKCAP